MWKIIGYALILGGVAGTLYDWIGVQKRRQGMLEEFTLFLTKSMYVMEKERVRIIELFESYTWKEVSDQTTTEKQLAAILHEIAKRLSTNTYPDGQMVWEEVFREEEQSLPFDKETFAIMLQSGNGFFGRSREENLCFLQKSVQELEEQQRKIREKDAQERKVWVPVGMLGAVMLVILFV